MAKSKWYLGKAFNAVKKGGARGLLAVAEIIGDEAQPITPFDIGELETSLTVAVDRNNLIAGVGFTKRVNGYDVATRQHEDLTYNHLPGREAKYLEKPFFELGPGLLPYTLRDEIKKELH